VRVPAPTADDPISAASALARIVAVLIYAAVTLVPSAVAQIHAGHLPMLTAIAPTPSPPGSRASGASVILAVVKLTRRGPRLALAARAPVPIAANPTHAAANLLLVDRLQGRVVRTAVLPAVRPIFIAKAPRFTSKSLLLAWTT